MGGLRKIVTKLKSKLAKIKERNDTSFEMFDEGHGEMFRIVNSTMSSLIEVLQKEQ